MEWSEEYLLPTQDQVIELFSYRKETMVLKVLQGFNHLEITPIAMPVELFIELMKKAIIKRGQEGKIYQTLKK